MSGIDPSNNLLSDSYCSDTLVSLDIKYPYLKKGEGKLASQFHGETKFSKQRKLAIIKEQEEREQKGWD